MLDPRIREALAGFDHAKPNPLASPVSADKAAPPPSSSSTKARKARRKKARKAGSSTSAGSATSPALKDGTNQTNTATPTAPLPLSTSADAGLPAKTQAEPCARATVSATPSSATTTPSVGTAATRPFRTVTVEDADDGADSDGSMPSLVTVSDSSDDHEYD